MQLQFKSKQSQPPLQWFGVLVPAWDSKPRVLNLMILYLWGLGLLHEFNNLGKSGISSHVGGGDQKGPVLIDGACNNCIARLFSHRHGLTWGKGNNRQHCWKMHLWDSCQLLTRGRTSALTSRLQICLKENILTLGKSKCWPVMRDSSTMECPSMTRPSTGNLPPGTTLTMSPRWTSSTSTCSSLEWGKCFIRDWNWSDPGKGAGTTHKAQPHWLALGHAKMIARKL